MRQVQQAAEMMSLVTRIGDLSHVLFLDVTMFVRLMDHHVKNRDGCPSYPFSPLGDFVLRRWRNVGEVDDIAELYETLLNAAKTADC
jgi:hypothetical protein